MENDPIIDCHQHTNWGGYPHERVVKYLDSLGVAKAWLLSWESLDGGLEPLYTHLSIEEVFEAHEQFPDRFIPFAGVDPRRDNAEQLLRDCHARGARGCGEIKIRAAYDNPDVLRLFRLAGELGMPVLLHLQYPTTREPTVWYGGSIGAVERAAKACPDTQFLGHAQSWWAHVSGDGKAEAGELYPTGPVGGGGEMIRLLETCPNLYADMSAGSGHGALTRDPEFGRKFAIDFADKLLYGVDGCDDRQMKLLREWDLPADVFARITSRNARRLLGE